MAKSSPKFEFASKSRKRRAEIFRDRAEKSVRALATKFYKDNDLSVDRAKLEKAVQAILDDLVSVVKEPTFTKRKLHPDINNNEALLDKLVFDVMKATSGKLPEAILAKAKKSPSTKPASSK